MMANAKSGPGVVRVRGPLEALAAGFGEELAELGFAPLSAANQLRVMAHLSRWLWGRGLGPGEFTAERADEFLADRRAAGYTHWCSARGLAPLLGYLRGAGAAPEPVVGRPEGLLDVLAGDYARFLVTERGLAASTVERRTRAARRFLCWWAARCGELDLAALGAGDVQDFVVAECGITSRGSAGLVVSDLRSLLGFLHLSGMVPAVLASAVPAVAGWRGSTMPRYLTRAEVDRLLASCDRRRAVGRRDFAILTLLSRLGLRAGEVAALGLGDVDWRAGELVVHGKGASTDRLPLPADVGEALVGYLRRGRPDCPVRTLFVRARAPYGAMTAAAVKGVVRWAAWRAGLGTVGAHRLRHTCATELLRAGGTLEAVGQVLRHRDVATTAIYAKVDRAALQALALPWPGGAR
jgi:site-specific recombinase XerD